ncbi:hypothetical protein DRO19_04260, partial [Candidatus Bathyarchaeota archaeon]
MDHLGRNVKLKTICGEGHCKVKLYKKEGNTVRILSFPTEQFEKGDYLVIEDSNAGKALLVQVVDIQFANVPGILEELLRECSQSQEYIEGENLDPLEVFSQITMIQDARMLICKIRAALENGKLTNNTAWLPSRTHSTIKKIPVSKLFSLAKVNGNFPIYLGETKEKSQLF